MDQNTVRFIYLKNKFSRISDIQSKEQVSVGHQTREIINDIKSEDQLSEVENSA
jgi:hypothetical protein